MFDRTFPTLNDTDHSTGFYTLVLPVLGINSRLNYDARELRR
ncbi:hypothetical protein [Mesorhizobium shangrilense]